MILLLNYIIIFTDSKTAGEWTPKRSGCDELLFFFDDCRIFHDPEDRPVCHFNGAFIFIEPGIGDDKDRTVLGAFITHEVDDHTVFLGSGEQVDRAGIVSGYRENLGTYSPFAVYLPA